MPRVIGIDPGTVSIDVCGLDGDTVWLDRSLPTLDALRDPASFIALLATGGPPDLIAGPSGYGLPMVRADQATDDDLLLAFLAPEGAAGGIGGLRQLARMLGSSGLPVVYTPGVVHLPTVPRHRKINRIDLGTADKVAAAGLAIWDQCRRLGQGPRESSFLLLELGGAFTAAVAVREGAIVDGVGGSAGPIGWRACGGWDGEVACLAGTVEKEMLFRGGAMELGEVGLAAYIEGVVKTAWSLIPSLGRPREILLSGRQSKIPAIRTELLQGLGAIAPVRDLTGLAHVAKEGAQGAAILADGLAGGSRQELVAALRIAESSGTVLDYLHVIPARSAWRRLRGE